MNTYDIQDSWTKNFVVTSFTCESLEPLTCLKNGEVLIFLV